MDPALSVSRRGGARGLTLRLLSILNRLAPLNHRLWPLVSRLLPAGRHVVFRYHGSQQLVIPRAWLNRYSTSLLLHGSAAANPEFGLMDEFLPQLLAARKDHAFVDIGAGIGAVVAWVRSRFPNPVYAFEPSPPTRAALQLTGATNRWTDVTIVAKALGAHAGTTVLDVRPNSALVVSGAEPAAQTVDVPLTTFDRELAAAPPIGFVKIDVEGYETEVLKGATALLTLHRPVLWMEAHPRLLRLHGSSLQEFSDLLEGRLQYGLQWLFWPVRPPASVAARIAEHYRPARARRVGSWRELPTGAALPEQVFVVGIPRPRAP